MDYKAFFETVINTLRERVNNKTLAFAKHVYGTYREGLCPYLEWIKIDCLEPQDWDYGIRENSIFVTFKIDMLAKKVEVSTCGHVWISDADKAAYPRDKYLAMHSMTEIAKRNGVKCIRKQSFKDEEDCVNKIEKVFLAIMEQVDDYCDGVYPYKKGVKMLKSSKY